MDGRSLTPAQIRQALDACREGGSELQQPELQEVAQRLASDPQLRATFARLQSLDRAIETALTHVPVPPDLEARLLARFERPAACPNAGMLTRTWTTRARWLQTLSRRRVLWTAAAALLILSVGAFYVSRPETNVNQVVSAAGTQVLEPGDWRPMRVAPAGFRLPRGFVRPIAWQPVKLLGVAGAAYNFSASARQRAVLYVIPLVIKGLPTGAPVRPQSLTGGQLIGAWRSSGFMYVLVVSGSASDARYRSLISRPTSPLA